MVNIASVEISKENQEVIIKGYDIESIWELEPDESSECSEISYRFDISQPRIRTYLFKVTKSCRKADKYQYMNQRLEALVGEIIYLSNNFKVKEV